jgi:hypothetical protein
LSFYLFVEHARAAQRWEAVDFEHPGLKVIIKHDVEAVDLEAALLPVSNLVQLLHDVWVDRNQCLDDAVIDSLEDELLFLLTEFAL